MAVPFLVILTVAGGSHWQALVAHLVILVFTLGAVCAIGLGFSSLTARPSASAVLTYIVVAALTVGTPLATAIASSVVTGTQTEVTYHVDYDKSTDDKIVCQSEPEIETHEVTRTDRIWWILTPNPFVALGDATAHAPLQPASAVFGAPDSFLSLTGEGIDTMRNPQPSRVVYNRCEDRDDSYDGPSSSLTSSDDHGPVAKHLAFWPASLVALTALGAGGVITASRRLRVPAGRLPRGVRLA